MNRPNSTIRHALATATACLLSACAGGDRYDFDTAAGTLAEANDWILSSVRTDANIMGALHQSNIGEMDAGRLAEDNASDSAVRAFAATMVDEHTRLDERGDSLARQLGVSPTAYFSALADIHRSNMTSLRAADTLTAVRGAPSSFDREFIARQIAVHRSAIELVDVSIQRAEHEDLMAALRNEVRPAIVRHLEHAEAIQRRIGRPPSDTLLRYRQ